MGEYQGSAGSVGPKVASLNARFGRPGLVEFEVSERGLAEAVLRSGVARARVALHGATVLSYKPAPGAEELLFVSSKSPFQAGKAIRGGVPLCWPWFGLRPEAPELPRHGFFRLFEWEVSSVSAGGEGAVLELALSASEATRAYWPHEFSALCRVSLGARLEVEVRVANKDSEPFPICGGFHPYFSVRELSSVGVSGLGGLDFEDRSASPSPAAPAVAGVETLAFPGELHRVYGRVPGPVTIVDRAAGRAIRVEGRGLDSLVLWNPGEAVSAGFPDMAEGEHRRFLCVEPVTLLREERSLGPGEELSSSLHVEAASART